MYVHPAFKTDLDQSLALLRERGFGTLVAVDGAEPVAVHVPFVVSPDGGAIELHVARANPIHAAIARHPRVLLTCTGPDAYIAPVWYASANQVPTWTYLAVHAAGVARLMEPEELGPHLDRLSAQFESGLSDDPWTPAKVDPQRIAAMSKAIVGIVIKLDSVVGQHKLNQHKAMPDHLGVVAGLRGQSDPAAHRIADLMDASRGIAPAPLKAAE
ncbi:MAG TPA: FMN-binding negative transcriptional regulator [Microvirga sp.]|jgi:transcriptional regulator|nr:FMN-binding negative transcriptional regulator [Microvirga sp.]